jgi:hypothetical protein
MTPFERILTYYPFILAAVVFGFGVVRIWAGG